jgi:hypothetical protein
VFLPGANFARHRPTPEIMETQSDTPLPLTPTLFDPAFQAISDRLIPFQP